MEKRLLHCSLQRWWESEMEGKRQHEHKWSTRRLKANCNMNTNDPRLSCWTTVEWVTGKTQTLQRCCTLAQSNEYPLQDERRKGLRLSIKHNQYQPDIFERQTNLALFFAIRVPWNYFKSLFKRLAPAMGYIQGVFISVVLSLWSFSVSVVFSAFGDEPSPHYIRAAAFVMEGMSEPTTGETWSHLTLSR